MAHRDLPWRRAALTAVSAVVWLLATWGSTVRVLSDGRGGHALGYDDVVYLVGGQRLAAEVTDAAHPMALVDWLVSGPHAPLTELAATLPPLIGLADAQAVYVLNGLAAGGLMLALATVLVATWWLRFGLAAVLTASPFGFLLANEFRPDLWFTAVAAIVLAGNVPYRWGGDRQRVLPLEASAALVLVLAVVKPSWLAFTATVTLAVTALAVASWVLAPRTVRRERRAHAWRAGIIVVIGLVVWYPWLSRHFVDYVLNGALLADYRLAESRRAAVGDSVHAAETYLGGGIVLVSVVGVAAALLSVWALLLTRSRRNVTASMLAALALPAVVIVGLVATWYSRHPSPFQGMFAYGLTAAFLLLVVSISLHAMAAELTAHRQQTVVVAVGAALPLVAVAVFVLPRSSLSYPEYTALPDAAPAVVGETIARDCAEQQLCPPGGPAVPVLVAMAEDMSSAGVEYYARSAGADVVTRDLADDTSDVAPAAALLDDVLYVLVRQENYEDNRLPKNMIQEDLLAVLRDRPGFSEIPIQAPGPAYSLFRNDARAT